MKDPFTPSTKRYREEPVEESPDMPWWWVALIAAVLILVVEPDWLVSLLDMLEGAPQ